MYLKPSKCFNCLDTKKIPIKTKKLKQLFKQSLKQPTIS